MSFFDKFEANITLVSGIYASNHDITHIFIDNIFKIVDRTYDADAEEFVKWCVAFSEKEKVNFTMTLSADVELASDEIKQLF